MSKNHAKLIETLVNQFGAKTSEFAGETVLILSAEHIHELSKLLHDKYGFDLLSALTAVDYWPEENPRFHVYYRFTSIPNCLTLDVRVPVSGRELSLPTVEDIYHNANWKEREVFDMFGIKFEGHSDLRRILMPFEWEGHPLRKDYPLGYEEPQFTFNFDEIDVRKPHAGE